MPTKSDSTLNSSTVKLTPAQHKFLQRILDGERFTREVWNRKYRWADNLHREVNKPLVFRLLTAGLLDYHVTGADTSLFLTDLGRRAMGAPSLAVVQRKLEDLDYRIKSAEDELAFLSTPKLIVEQQHYIDFLKGRRAALRAADAGSSDAATKVLIDEQGFFDRGMSAYKNGSKLIDVLRYVTDEFERKQITDGYEYAKLHYNDGMDDTSATKRGE